MIYKEEWENIHKHTKYSNVSTMDSRISIVDIAKRAVELGQKTLSTVEHGFAGNVFEYYDVAKEYGLKFIFGVEFYYVHDRFSKDKTNSHILILAKNSNGKRQLTKLISESNLNGFYYKNRIDKELLFSLKPDDVVVTTACIGGVYGKYDDEQFILECYHYFGDNFYLGLHANTHPKQTDYNKKLLRLHETYNIPLMFEADTHYILPEDAKWRDLLLRGKGMFYEDEDGFVMDYPDTKTIFKRFEEQGIFTREQVKQALRNTLIVRDFEDIVMNKDIKMPTMYPNLTHEEKVKKLKGITTSEWIEDRKHIDKTNYKKYLDAIRFEMDIIDKTHTEDYFLLNYEIIKRAKEKGGILTRTGRGSAPSYYLNKLYGFTEIDRLDAPITLYPTRFMSISRILETKSLPDIDFNCVDAQPFVESAKEILGEDNVYWMVAYGTMQESEAFRHMCRALGMHDDNDEVNEVGKNLDQYKTHPKWKDIIEDSKMFIDVINSVSPHPCFMAGELVMTDKGYKKIENISVGDYVLTHNNRFEKVINTMIHESSDIYNLKIMGIPTTNVTGTHPYYVREMYKENQQRFFTKPKWKNVDNLKKNDYIGIAINQNNIIPNGNLPFKDLNFWWVIGRYIGDGWFKNLRPNHKQQGEYNTIICVGKHELTEVTQILDNLNNFFHYHVTEERTTYRINILSKQLWEFVQQFGKGALNKRLTNTIFDLPVYLLQSFIEGYVSADGYIDNEENISITTVSKELAYGISSCINKAFKRHTSICLTKRKDTILEGRVLKGNYQYIVDFSKEKKKSEQAFYENGYIWTPFRKTLKQNITANVYNFEVSNDNSYTVNNAIVHNCANLLLSEPISEEVGLLRVGDESKGKKKIVYCALIDSDTSDAWKYLKNDFLTVTVWRIISDVFNAINKPIPDVRTLSRLVENNKNVWDLYEYGLTATLNQVGSDSGTPQVMQYKPKSIRELSGWVSAIRPAFSSMKHYFLNREPFSYGIPEFDYILKESDNFILYQENIMSALVYAGFSEDVTYGLLKAIAKKKEGIIEPIHDKFIKGFVDKTGSEENALRVWKILEDAVGYGFNSSHSYAVAVDSIYGAYLKAEYPLDYYKIVLNIYEKNVKIQSKLMKELEYFKIQVRPIQFGKSKADYEADYDSNTIYKGIASIKNLNAKIANSLYKLSKEKKYDTTDFVSLLIDISKLEDKPDAGQMEILIKLDFFKEFGQKEVLLEIFQTFADRKKASTDLYPDFAEQKYLEKVVKKRDGSLEEKWKTINKLIVYKPDLTEKNFEERMKNIYEYQEAVKKNPPPKIDLYEQIKFEKDILGYATTIYENVDYDICLITDINTKYSPVLTLYRLCNGEEFRIKIAKKKFFTDNDQLLYEGDIIHILELEEKNAKKLVDGKWFDNEAKKDLWCERLQIVKRGKRNG